MNNFVSVLLTVLVLALGYAASWGMFIGIAHLICLCFSWNFNLVTITGVWLIVCLIRLCLPGRRS
jgi:hypothetical protein